jgi:hypothetical protein
MKDGHRSICTPCGRTEARERMAKHRLDHPDRVRESSKKYVMTHKEEIRERGKENYIRNREKRLEAAAKYRAENREYINQWIRDYRLANIDKYQENDRQYYAKNKEEMSEKAKIYRETHRDQIRECNRARKAAIKNSTTDFAKLDWEKCLEYWNNRCAICGRGAGEANGFIISTDHWIPLSKGGPTSKKNIIPICHGKDGCNNKKRNTMPDVWLVRFLGKDKAEQKEKEIQDYFDSL